MQNVITIPPYSSLRWALFFPELAISIFENLHCWQELFLLVCLEPDLPTGGQTISGLSRETKLHLFSSHPLFLVLYPSMTS